MDSFVPQLNARLPIIRRNALGREITNGAQLNTAIDVWNALPVCSGPNQIPCNPGVQLSHVNPNLKFGHDFNTLDLGVSRSWTFPHETSLKFEAQVFNLFNVTNIRGTNNKNYSDTLTTSLRRSSTSPCKSLAASSGRAVRGFFNSLCGLRSSGLVISLPN